VILDRHPSMPGRWTGKKFVGYWHRCRPEWAQPFSDPEIERFIASLPDPHDHVDESWDPAERAMVVERLRLGTEFVAWKGVSWCRFGCKASCGSRCLTFDGTFVWPEGLAHYVEAHDLRVPQALVDHLRDAEPFLVEELRRHIAEMARVHERHLRTMDGADCPHRGVSCRSSETSTCVRGNFSSYKCQASTDVLLDEMDAERDRHASTLLSLGIKVQDE
jgi:hypothetical protein